MAYMNSLQKVFLIELSHFFYRTLSLLLQVALLPLSKISPHDKLMRLKDEIVFEIALRKPLAAPKED